MQTTRGFSLPFLLTVVFVTLKLTHVIAWSWWVVFLPMLISAGLGLLVLGVVGIVAVMAVSRGK